MFKDEVSLNCNGANFIAFHRYFSINYRCKSMILLSLHWRNVQRWIMTELQRNYFIVLHRYFTMNYRFVAMILQSLHCCSAQRWIITALQLNWFHCSTSIISIELSMWSNDADIIGLHRYFSMNSRCRAMVLKSLHRSNVQQWIITEFQLNSHSLLYIDTFQWIIAVER